MDKKGMNDLLASLERVCTEYQGMKYILDHPPVAELWRPQLAHYRNAPEFARLGQHRFDELRDRLLSDAPDPAVFESLKSILDRIVPSRDV